MRVKYIIFKTSMGELPIIFSEVFTHLEMKNKMDMTPVSAGFVSLSVEHDHSVKYGCYGDSVSLELKARDQDSRIINQHFNNN